MEKYKGITKGTGMSNEKSLDNAAFMVKVRKTLAYYGKKILWRWRDLIFPLLQPEFKRPVIVVGCSRSGTTAVYNVLGMAPELATMRKESHDFWNMLHPLAENNWNSHVLTEKDVTGKDKREVPKFFYRYLGAKRFLDKANQNCFRIPYLHALFPDAYFVFIRRDGRDNINSMIHGWGRPDEYASWSQDLPSRVEIDNGSYNRWCFFLFPGWREFTSKSIEEVCATQWMEANRAVLNAKNIIPSDHWVEIVYEDLLRQPVETFHHVFSQLHISFSNEIRKHCENLSSKPYNAFSRPRLDKWKEENRERIESIIPMISGMMEILGYRNREDSEP